MEISRDFVFLLNLSTAVAAAGFSAMAALRAADTFDALFSGLMDVTNHSGEQCHKNNKQNDVFHVELSLYL